MLSYIYIDIDIYIYRILNRINQWRRLRARRYLFHANKLETRSELELPFDKFNYEEYFSLSAARAADIESRIFHLNLPSEIISGNGNYLQVGLMD